jgi:hypothetical protein
MRRFTVCDRPSDERFFAWLVGHELFLKIKCDTSGHCEKSFRITWVCFRCFCTWRFCAALCARAASGPRTIFNRPFISGGQSLKFRCNSFASRRFVSIALPRNRRVFIRRIQRGFLGSLSLHVCQAFSDLFGEARSRLRAIWLGLWLWGVYFPCINLHSPRCLCLRA